MRIGKAPLSLTRSVFVNKDVRSSHLHVYWCFTVSRQELLISNNSSKDIAININTFKEFISAVLLSTSFFSFGDVQVSISISIVEFKA